MLEYKKKNNKKYNLIFANSFLEGFQFLVNRLFASFYFAKHKDSQHTSQHKA